MSHAWPRSYQTRSARQGWSRTRHVTTYQADLLRGCHQRRLRSAISACPPPRLWGSSASRLGGWAAKAGKGRPPRAAGTRTHDPGRTSSHVRKAPGSVPSPAAITTCPAGCGRSSRRPPRPRGSSSATSRSPRSASGWTRLPAAGTGLPSRLRRDPRPADGHLHYLPPGSRCAMRASRAICYGSRRDDMSRLSRSWNRSLVPPLPSVIPENVTKYVSELQICLSRLSESNR